MHNSKLLLLLPVVLLAIGTSNSGKTTCDNFYLRLFMNVGCNLTELRFSTDVVGYKSFSLQINDTRLEIMTAQLSMGVLKTKSKKEQNSTELRPVCGFPSKLSSDMSLEMFLKGVLTYNTESLLTDRPYTKGAKLKFYDTETFNSSIKTFRYYYDMRAFTILFDANILVGPGKPFVAPVDPNVFFSTLSRNFEDCVLSVGWTSDGKGDKLTQEEFINPMIEVIKRHKITQLITFPVRAGNAANSVTELQGLLHAFPNSTLHIWSSVGDQVDVKKLRKLVTTIGWDMCSLNLANDLTVKLFDGWKVKPMI